MKRRIAMTGSVLAALVLGLLWWSGDAGEGPRAEAKASRAARKKAPKRLPRAPQIPDAPAVVAAPPVEDVEEEPRADTGAAARGEWIVHGSVVDGSGRVMPRVAVQCTFGDRQITVRTDGQGQFEARLPEPGECRAFRRDGVLLARSDAWSVGGEPGEFDMELVLPFERTGGIGIGFEATEEGMVITEVHPETPAGRAGLEPGDLIVEVDGLPAGALDAMEFVETMTGPEGTGVTFTVAYATDTGFATEEHRVVRSYLERAEGGGVRAAPVDTGG
jgi:hypothetical protein